MLKIHAVLYNSQENPFDNLREVLIEFQLSNFKKAIYVTKPNQTGDYVNRTWERQVGSDLVDWIDTTMRTQEVWNDIKKLTKSETKIEKITVTYAFSENISKELYGEFIKAGFIGDRRYLKNEVVVRQQKNST